MAILTVQRPVLTSGTLLSLQSGTSAGDSFPNTGVEWFHVLNSTATTKTVTFDSPGTCSHGASANAAHDLSISVAQNERRKVGPFPRTRFNDANDRVQVSYTDNASGLTVGVEGPPQ